MVALSKTTLAAAGTLAIAVIGLTMFGGQAQAMPRNLCESASAKGTVSCCNSWIKTPDGRKWRKHGFNCASPRSVVCRQTNVILAAAVARRKLCYLQGSPILLEVESHDNNRRGGRQSRGQNGNTKP